MPKVILDLCGGTGAWSAPYREAGYEVINVTLPEHNVITYVPDHEIYGILAAPPCDHFSGSGAQYWPAKDADGRTIGAMAIVMACLRIVALTEPVWWALENPVGRLRRWMGDPQMMFNPYDFGDPYTKKTLLWGVFDKPAKTLVEPVKVCNQGSWLMKLGGKSAKTKRLRGTTPPGFAKAFFNANP